MDAPAVAAVRTLRQQNRGMVQSSTRLASNTKMEKEHQANPKPSGVKTSISGLEFGSQRFTAKHINHMMHHRNIKVGHRQ